MNYKVTKILTEILIRFVGLSVIIAFLLTLGYINTHYSREGFVSPTKYKNEYLFRDLGGDEWIFYSDDYIKPHTRINVKMFNNCTERDIKDDMIVDYTIID